MNIIKKGGKRKEKDKGGDEVVYFLYLSWMNVTHPTDNVRIGLMYSLSSFSSHRNKTSFGSFHLFY